MKDKNIHIRLTPYLHNKLLNYSQAMEKTRGEVVRELIESFFKK
jgi:predicted DNA-binding protein